MTPLEWFWVALIGLFIISVVISKIYDEYRQNHRIEERIMAQHMHEYLANIGKDEEKAVQQKKFLAAIINGTAKTQTSRPLDSHQMAVEWAAHTLANTPTATEVIIFESTHVAARQASPIRVSPIGEAEKRPVPFGGETSKTDCMEQYRQNEKNKDLTIREQHIEAERKRLELGGASF